MEKGERKETRREEMGERIGERGEVKERERESRMGNGTGGKSEKEGKVQSMPKKYSCVTCKRRHKTWAPSRGTRR